MYSHRIQVPHVSPETLALAVFAVMVALPLALSFNGLYGQDAHEYLRLAQVYFARMNGEVVPPQPHEGQLALGYPMLGAMLHFLIPDLVLALQLISAVSAAACVWLFERLLRQLTPGAWAQGRMLYAALLLVTPPVFMRAGTSVMSDALGLALLLAALLACVHALQRPAWKWAAAAVVLSGWSVTVRYSHGLLLMPLLTLMVWRLWLHRSWGGLSALLPAALLGILPYVWAAPSDMAHQHSYLNGFSVMHLFRRSFIGVSGLVQYRLPNILYILYVVFHPGYCLVLGLLFLVARRTDFIHPEQRALLLGLVVYLLFLGMVPAQNLRYMLPAYLVLLLLLFPAWDRYVSYGFYFLKKKWMYPMLFGILAVQIAANLYSSRDMVLRNHLERQMAAQLRPALPQGATVFGIDVDIALRSYLPDIQWKNMWVERYAEAPVGSFVIFNEPLLRQQWEGRNPMLNWNFIRENYVLEEKMQLPGTWVLYEVKIRSTFSPENRGQ